MHGHPYSKRARVLTGPVQPAEQPLPALFIQLRHLLRRAAAVPMLRAGAFGESRKARAGSVTEVDVLAGQFQLLVMELLARQVRPAVGGTEHQAVACQGGFELRRVLGEAVTHLGSAQAQAGDLSHYFLAAALRAPVTQVVVHPADRSHPQRSEE